MAKRKPEPFLTLGFAAISWIEHYLVHGPGDVQGQPVELDDEFAAFTLKAYRVNARGGQRKVRRAFLSRAKGRSKSGFAAFIECFEALGPCRFDHWAEAGEVSDWGYEYDEGEPVGRPLTYVEILNVATEEGQAGNTYDAVYYMLHPDTASDALLEDYGRLDVGLTRINLPDKRGFIEPVTAANESKDGGKSTFIVADETHLWIPPTTPGAKFKLGKMHQTMVRNLLKRKVASGWMLETSTMYADGEKSVAEGTHAYAKALIKAGRDDGRLLFDHRQASEHWDLENRRERISALKEAYGPAAAWMDLEAIADYWDDPQASHAEFRRFFLNQPVPTEEPVQLIPELPAWPDRVIERTKPPALGAIGIAVSRDLSWSAICSAGQWPDERVHLGIGQSAEGRVDHDRGTAWLVARAKYLQDTYRCVVALDEKCPDQNLATRLRDAGVDVTELDTADMLDGTSGLINDVAEGKVTHFGEDDFTEARAVLVRRDVNDRPLWGRKQSTGDITPIEAATVARKALLDGPGGPLVLTGSLMAKGGGDGAAAGNDDGADQG